MLHSSKERATNDTVAVPVKVRYISEVLKVAVMPLLGARQASGSSLSPKSLQSLLLPGLA